MFLGDDGNGPPESGGLAEGAIREERVRKKKPGGSDDS